uniref:TIR domain-containing protein n=1 Tax=Chaetoceros debilis TaxID=122233 RepID=A0A7S3QF82_9STRA
MIMEQITRPTAMRTKSTTNKEYNKEPNCSNGCLECNNFLWCKGAFKSHSSFETFNKHDAAVEEEQTKQEESEQIGNPYVREILTIKAFNLLSSKLAEYSDDIDKVITEMNEEGAKNIEEFIATIEEVDYEDSDWITSNSIPFDIIFNLFQAQGILFRYDGLLYIDPRFISRATKPLVDHTLDVDWLKQKASKDLLLDFIEDPPSKYPHGTTYKIGDMKKSMNNLLTSGYLDMNSVDFLWRNVPLKYQDYEPFLKMLIDSGIIFRSSVDPSSNDNDDEDSKDTYMPLEGHAVILYRLKETCNAEELEKVWKPKPFHMELRIFLPRGCPPSLAANFAAYIHSLGHCCFAYIHGAVVCTTHDNNYIRADLMKDEDGEDYLSCAIRSSNDLGTEGYRILARMLKIVEKEKEIRLPGLIYDPKIVLPQRLSTDGRPTSVCSQLSWSSEDGHEFCDERKENVFVRGFGTFMIENEDMNASNTSKTDDTASGLLKPLVRPRHVLMSARFLGDTTEKRAREIYSELRALGVNVFMVEVGPGETFGDETNFGLYYMVAMIAICSDNYGQKTESVYSSHAEVKFAFQERRQIIPVKFGKKYPPEPLDSDGGNAGTEQNRVVFSKDLIYCDWSTREWDAKECAEEIKKALEKMDKCPMLDATS